MLPPYNFNCSMNEEGPYADLEHGQGKNMNKCRSEHLLSSAGRGTMHRALCIVGAGTVTSGVSNAAPGLILSTCKRTLWLTPDSSVSRLESGLSGSSSCSALRTVSYQDGCLTT